MNVRTTIVFSSLALIYLATLPLRRLTAPAEVARCVEYLVCDGTFSTGDVVNVNAGAVI